MSAFYARAVFFVSDAERARRFYTDELGFALDWDSQDGVFQVNLFGFELIINDTGARTRPRVGHGRVFIGLEDDQGESFRKHVAEREIQTYRVTWGRPTLMIRDQDANEIFFWLPNDDFSDLGKPALDVDYFAEPAT